MQESWGARIPIVGKLESLNEILEGAQEVPGDSREIREEIARKADASVERRVKFVLDPKSDLILNAKKEDPILNGPYARVTEEEKESILAELRILR